MRKQPRRMLGLSLIAFASMMLTVVGCQSTGTVPQALKGDPVAKTGKGPITLTSADDVVWRRSPPSTAQTPEQWANPPKKDDSVRAMAFQSQQPLAVEPLPIPEAMKKDAPKPMVAAQTVPLRNSGQPVAAQPVGFRHGGKQIGGAPMALALPGAPTEANQVPVEYRIRPPDVLLIDSLKGLVNAPVNGPYTVRPDGTVGISIYGSAPIAGLTLDEAKPVIARVIFSKMAQEPYPDRDEKGIIR